MDRKHLALAGLLVFACAQTDFVHAQAPADPAPTAGRMRRSITGPEGAVLLRDRQKLRRNAERWLQMTPDEQQFLRQREIFRQERIRREAQSALKDSGLRLDPQKQELFQMRYMQERKSLEQGLHSELEEKRQQRLPPLLDRLRREFELVQSPQPAPSAAATPVKPADR